MKAFLSRIFLVLSGLLLLLQLSPVFAEDLILEFDPDEYLTGEEVPTVDTVEFERQIQQDQQLQGSLEELYSQGYQSLFEYSAQELAGLKAVLQPLKEDLSLIDAQIQRIDLQRQRVLQQQQYLRDKQLQLSSLESRFTVQAKLLELETRDLRKTFQQMVGMFFRVKRQFVGEGGQFNVLQWLTSQPEPSELVFQDYLLQRLSFQLKQKYEEMLSLGLQVRQLQDRLQLVKQAYSLQGLQLQESEQVLVQQQQYQQQLLTEKSGEQRFFAAQLEQATVEYEAIQKRIEALAGGVTSFAYQSLPDEQLQWPVAPLLGVSAGFHDSAYKARFGVNHNAVDIPTDQLTPIKAPLSGQVIEVHDGGETGYSYLQLAHKGGLSTVYGHVFSFLVEEGQMVRQGQVVALSGGAVGTHGAGRLTTGPHLHFEVLLEGVHVDPRDYLPALTSE